MPDTQLSLPDRGIGLLKSLLSNDPLGDTIVDLVVHAIRTSEPSAAPDLIRSVLAESEAESDLEQIRYLLSIGDGVETVEGVRRFRDLATIEIPAVADPRIDEIRRALDVSDECDLVQAVRDLRSGWLTLADESDAIRAVLGMDDETSIVDGARRYRDVIEADLLAAMNERDLLRNQHLASGPVAEKPAPVVAIVEAEPEPSKAFQLFNKRKEELPRGRWRAKYSPAQAMQAISMFRANSDSVVAETVGDMTPSSAKSLHESMDGVLCDLDALSGADADEYLGLLREYLDERFAMGPYVGGADPQPDELPSAPQEPDPVTVPNVVVADPPIPPTNVWSNSLDPIDAQAKAHTLDMRIHALMADAPPIGTEHKPDELLQCIVGASNGDGRIDVVRYLHISDPRSGDDVWRWVRFHVAQAQKLKTFEQQEYRRVLLADLAVAYKAAHNGKAKVAA